MYIHIYIYLFIYLFMYGYLSFLYMYVYLCIIVNICVNVYIYMYVYVFLILYIIRVSLYISVWYHCLIYTCIIWLVVETVFIFHCIWDNPSHWLIFFKMVKPPTSYKWPQYVTTLAFWPGIASTHCSPGHMAALATLGLLILLTYEKMCKTQHECRSCNGKPMGFPYLCHFLA